MFRKNRKNKKNIKKRVVFLFVVLLLIGGGVFFFLFLRDMSSVTVLQPVPSGVPFNVASKGSDQRLKEVEAFLTTQQIPYDSVGIASDSAILVSLKDNGTVYLSSGNYTEELTSLQVIVGRLTMEGKRFSRLDLRFERPVIVMP